MAYTRKGVPAGWTWRDGRGARWIPSPSLRTAGWRGLDLKDGVGAWLARGASIEAALALNAAVAGWRAGRLVPAAWAPCAPPAALEQPGAGRPAPAAPGRRSLGVLLDEYLASREFKGLGAKTREDRRSKLSRALDVLAGYAAKPAPPKVRRDRRKAEATQALKAHGEAMRLYAARRAQVRGLSIDTLAPPEFDAAATPEEARGPLYAVYWTLHDEVGAHMAHGVLAAVSAWLTWCRKDRRAIAANWAADVDRETPPGRIRVGTWAELAALIEAAEQAGLPSIADAIVLGVDLSWSQGDRLALKWPQIDEAGRVKGARLKTGRKGETPLLEGLGKPRVAAIRARQKARYGETVTPTHVLVCELTDQPWTASLYRHKFAEIRAVAALTCPSVADLRDQDLRDTAITVAFNAGLSIPEIATRSLHSLKRIHDVLDKHYAELGQEIADAGATKLNAYLGGKGITL